MCGLLTFVSADATAGEHRERIASALETMHHRGPDETGVTTAGDDVVLSFKRLSIIDVAKSHQPIEYADGRYVMTFNGEVYNYIELRAELIEQGATFATDGDSEVVLAAYHHWGPESVSRLRGMFAYLIWDREERRLFGARDPFGIKPMHVLETREGVYFASEKKALMPFLYPRSQGLDTEALQHYLTLQYVPEPATLHERIRKVESGMSVSWSPGGQLTYSRYFRPTFDPAPVDDTDKLYLGIREVLEESVRIHLRADVPVGAFLSSGIDSTGIVALAKKHKPDILTFTVGYDVDGYSEIDIAQKSARWLGVTTIPTVVDAQQMMDALPRIVWHLDDPVADPALVPLYFVAEEAAKHVTVVLSGEGADEFFGGYNIYREPLSLRPLSGLPSGVRKGMLAVSRAIPEGVRGKSLLERGATPIRERYYGNARMFTEEEKQDLLVHYDPRVSYLDITRRFYDEAADYDDVTKMQYVDLFTWLRGDILVKADRMSMAHSLELRVPFLDTGVFEVASKIPLEQRITKQTTKLALRKALEGLVPPHVVERRKLGFPVPIRLWLKDVMYDWAMSIVDDSGTDELIDKAYVRNMLVEHRAGEVDRSRKIWTVLVFMLWHAIYVEHRLDPEPPKAVSRHATGT
ncbi:MAG: asparagine synthase (glutamine-hydrolyzing) [Pseudonocardiales bacterium]|nr:MAG: asparagine synthase (glutamine-hydrolyzing) [Pseudonocardiales bacterium]